MTLGRDRFPVLVTTALGLGIGLGLLVSCELPNPDHCINLAEDADAWCAERDAAYPYCSPCWSHNHGCVAKAPTSDRCPAYSSPPLDTTGGTGS